MCVCDVCVCVCVCVCVRARARAMCVCARARCVWCVCEVNMQVVCMHLTHSQYMTVTSTGVVVGSNDITLNDFSGAHAW